MVTVGQRKVLNVGSGPRSLSRLHPIYTPGQWVETRLDIDPAAEPDLLGTATDMRAQIATGTYDSVWSSHNIEHLHAHEALLALKEFHRILRRDGFALINCPDLEEIARLILDAGVEETAYISPAGPITPLDMLYGHSSSITRGNTFMAHKTGFTQARMTRIILEAGFAEAWVVPGAGMDLWAVALMTNADRDGIRQALLQTGLDFPD